MYACIICKKNDQLIVRFQIEEECVLISKQKPSTNKKTSSMRLKNLITITGIAFFLERRKRIMDY